jgi:uncharacterized protein (TIGR02466 family)
MNETRLFYTPLWQTDIADPDEHWPQRRELMLTRIAQLAAEGSGVQKTNFGGWQSPDDLYRYPEFQWLIGRIMAKANEVAPAFSAKRRFDDGIMWANINRRGDFNAMHTHPDAVLSGVVYLRFERREQGVIQFFDAREGNPTSQWRCFMRLEDGSPLLDDVHEVEPREGNLLFFPGWLKHWVTPNLTDTERVSVSFNLRLE